MSIWWEIFNFVLLSQKRSFQFNSRIVRTHFASAMTLDNCDIIEETRSCIFRWRSRCRRRRLCLSSLILATFRLQYEDDYEYEFSVLSTRFRFGGRKFSKCACSELKTRTRSRPRTPIWRSLLCFLRVLLARIKSVTHQRKQINQIVPYYLWCCALCPFLCSAPF